MFLNIMCPFVSVCNHGLHRVHFVHSLPPHLFIGLHTFLDTRLIHHFVHASDRTTMHNLRRSSATSSMQSSHRLWMWQGSLWALSCRLIQFQRYVHHTCSTDCMMPGLFHLVHATDWCLIRLLVYGLAITFASNAIHQVHVAVDISNRLFLTVLIVLIRMIR